VPRGTTPTASAVDESLISIITSSNQILDGQNQQNNATSYEEISYLNVPGNWKPAWPMIMNPKPKAKAVSIAERTVPFRCEVVMSRVRALSLGKFPTESMATKRGVTVKPSCREICSLFAP
jgi:hypothetical protein